MVQYSTRGDGCDAFIMDSLTGSDSMVRYGTVTVQLRHGTSTVPVWYGTVRYGTIRYDTVQYGTVVGLTAVTDHRISNG